MVIYFFDRQYPLRKSRRNQDLMKVYALRQMNIRLYQLQGVLIHVAQHQNQKRNQADRTVEGRPEQRKPGLTVMKQYEQAKRSKIFLWNHQ